MIVSPTEESIRAAAERLGRGELVAMPTETVYGLAAAVFHEEAVARIFAAKERPAFDPLIVHVPESARRIDQLEQLGLVDGRSLSREMRAIADALLDRFWPGPFTLVLPRHTRVPDLVTSGLSTVGVRMPRHPVAQALLAHAGPLAAPSANRFGRISPTCAEDVDAELGDRVGTILDGGPCTVGVESTVIALDEESRLVLLRPGGTPIEAIARVAGAAPKRIGDRDLVRSPGMLASHYAPERRMLLLPARLESIRDLPRVLHDEPWPKCVGLLAQMGDPARLAAQLELATGSRAVVRVLSRTGDLPEKARNLFAAIRALDESDAELLLAEPCDETHGIGHAIRDRLERACRRKELGDADAV